MFMSILKKILHNELGQLFCIHLVVAAVLGLLSLGFLKQPLALSFLAGEGLLTFSLLSFGLVLAFQKFQKNWGLLLCVIVFKWPFLLYVVFVLTNRYDLPTMGMVAGLMVWLISVPIWMTFQKDG